MTADHLVKERDIKETCFYCMRPLEGWKSEFHANKHYKSITCQCGKTNKVQMNYEGSGHDTWTAPKVQLAAKAPLDVQVKAMSK
jgi:hypothetical protein